MKVAIITGAGSGIGLGIAEKLAAMDIAVVGVGRDSAKLDALKTTIGDPEKVETVSADVMADDAPKRITDAALSRWGRVDFLVNNAGVGSPTPLHETTDENLDFFLNVMLRAPFRLAREVVPHMKPGSGVVNVTSVFAIVGGKRGGPYSAAKGGLEALTKHMACEYGPEGIRSNCVAPGVIPTPMTFHRLESEPFRRMNNDMTPYPRLGTVNDIASTVAFLCSEGGEFINGQTIAVDGGWTSTKYLSDRGLLSDWVEKDPE